ncbi:uncharacterized protein LOC118183844 isoform X2 [Stegodyphus dumicola]|nr:uncharacterized protein LOC118183844 isoform X2 [Stegodyphus dumicola]
MLSIAMFLCLWLPFVTGKMEFPNPQIEWRMCGRPEPSFICDPEFILDRGNVERLDELANMFRRSTTCLCPSCPSNAGVSIGIFIRSNITEETLMRYQTGRAVAEMLRKRWNLGKCDDDILIVLLTHQNISDFSMGSAVRKILSEQTAMEILKECRIHFDSGWFYQGLESVVNSFNDVIVQIQKEQKQSYRGLMVGIALGFGVLLVLAVVAFVILHYQSRISKQRCSDIYESMPKLNNSNKFSVERGQEYQLQKLNEPNTSDEDGDDNYEETSYNQNTFTASSVFHARMQRQLSDVTEESSDDSEVIVENSDNISPKFSLQPSKENTHKIPITEL